MECSQTSGTTLLILYSSGDLGDVGRHCVVLAQAHPNVRRIKVLTINQSSENLYDPKSYSKCACPPHTHMHFYRVNDKIKRKNKNHDKDARLQVCSVDLKHDDFLPHFVGVDVVISCLGNRRPFDRDASSHIAKVGTEQLIHCILQLDHRPRLLQLSSVGIGSDWPPLPGSREGHFLAGLFRTICWNQFQDLSGAERAVHRTLLTAQLDYVTARCVILPDNCEPRGRFRVVPQPPEEFGWKRCDPHHKVQDDMLDGSIAKLDVAGFLLCEALFPTLHRQVVLVGGETIPVQVNVPDAPPAVTPYQATDAWFLRGE